MVSKERQIEQTEQQIESIEKKLKQAKAKKQQLLQQQKQAERKARTKRLIEIGGIVEHFGGGELQDKEGFAEFLKTHALEIDCYFKKALSASNSPFEAYKRQYVD